MKNIVHTIYLLFLFLLGFITVAAIGIRNFDYYTLSIEERPYHERYEQLKPSGIESHGYGIVGSAMVIIGVVMYSTRKRIRAMSYIGKIKYFLEFHIFLCLLGPMLILYHTTFKFGGLVAVSFWSMTAVVLSGVVGRYLYVQIPKGIHGNELTIEDMEADTVHLYHQLIADYGLDVIDLQKIDALAKPKNERESSVLALLTFFIFSDITRRQQLRKIVFHLHGKSVKHETIKKITHIANERIKLLRRIHFLEQLKNLFHYWHVVHLPFTIIMFIILFVHIGVAVVFGYTWIF
ncbi:MAG: hypothetical protein PHP42_03775 [Bacteroidota bacterium]|nr:hypothetical protein [Bacteroidota bacterium]